jgi:hypothetical protein
VIASFGYSATAQVTYSFDFSSSDRGWIGGFADYPVGDEDFYALETDHRSLPSELGPDSALFITGNNHSDDLLMYFAKQVDGLLSTTTYRIVFDVVFASNVPKGSIGVGGSPSESVWIKVGATPDRPDRFVDDLNWYRMTTDIGNQSQSGAEAIVLSTFGKPEDGTDNYVLISASNEGRVAFEATTDDSGSLWCFLGVDSGFEATTSIYFTEFEALFTEIAGTGPGCGANGLVGVSFFDALGDVMMVLVAGATLLVLSRNRSEVRTQP